MDKYKKYYGVFLFTAVVVVVLAIVYIILNPRIKMLASVSSELEQQEQTLEQKKRERTVVETKIKKIKDSIAMSQKKIYSPLESDLGNDTLFFTLYNDLIEMIHANSIKVKSIDYTCNPQNDEFVKFGKDVYLVYDVNMELISNYVNLGKFIQDVYQYPYYIKINSLTVEPYAKDKRILISTLSLRLYAHTAPDEQEEDTTPLTSATTALPQ